MDYSLPGFSVHGTLQERILEWVAMPSSRGSSQPRDQPCYVFCIGRWFLLSLGPPGKPIYNSVQFNHSVMSDSWQPQGLQHTRLPCPSPTPGACSNSCPLSQWCHPTISSSVVPSSSRFQSFPASVFSSESVLCIRWPKYWSFSFSISPSNDYSGLISFRMDWFDLAVQGTQDSSPTPQFKSINSSVLSFKLLEKS